MPVLLGVLQMVLGEFGSSFYKITTRKGVQFWKARISPESQWWTYKFRKLILFICKSLEGKEESFLTFKREPAPQRKSGCRIVLGQGRQLVLGRGQRTWTENCGDHRGDMYTPSPTKTSQVCKPSAAGLDPSGYLGWGLWRSVFPYSMSLSWAGCNRLRPSAMGLQILVDPCLNFPTWTLLFPRLPGYRQQWNDWA